MAPVKAVFDLIDQIGCVPVEVIERHVDLENLFAVAHLGGPLDCSGSTEPGTKPATGLLLQLCEEIPHFVRCNARSCTVMRPTHFIAQVTSQHAPCRQYRRGGRYDDALDSQFARDFEGVQTRRAAKTQERKPPRTEPALSGPTRNVPPAATVAMDPPPAAILAMSRLRSAIRCPASIPSAESEARPCEISEISVLVPPMSNGTTSGMPRRSAHRRLPEIPPAGPDSTVPAARREASSRGAMPPCDSTINRLPLKPASTRRRSRLLR